METHRSSTYTDTVDGYTIVRELGGYTLTDPDGAYRMIDGFGCVAPNYRSAVAERSNRIESDRRAELAFAASR